MAPWPSLQGVWGSSCCSHPQPCLQGLQSPCGSEGIAQNHKEIVYFTTVYCHKLQPQGVVASWARPKELGGQ